MATVEAVSGAVDPPAHCPPGGMDAELAALEQRVRDLDAFSRHVAHELQTPLGQLEAIAALLQRQGPVDAAASGWLQLVGSLAAHMRHTVNDMLDMARSTAGALPAEDIDLTALCHRLAAELSPAPPARRVAWYIQPAMVVQGHRPQIALLMRNLLSNAVKYSREQAEPAITVTARPLGEGQQVTVQDNGAGFDAARGGQLFQPFVRLHDVQRFAGLGLGLSIAQRVVELHRGWARASGEAGAGARFDVWLPDVA
jgi:signal transduction histidine kinase